LVFGLPASPPGPPLNSGVSTPHSSNALVISAEPSPPKPPAGGPPSPPSGISPPSGFFSGSGILPSAPPGEPPSPPLNSGSSTPFSFRQAFASSEMLNIPPELSSLPEL